MDSIVERARAGDESARTELCDKLYEVIYGALVSFRSQFAEDEIKEIAQKTIANILKKYLFTKDSLDDFLKAASEATRHQAIDLLRERKTQKRRGDLQESLEHLRESEQFEPPDLADSPDLIVQRAETAARVAAALARIPNEKHRQALEDYIDELSYKQIAEKRGWTEDCVTSYIRRGKEALAKILNKEELFL